MKKRMLLILAVFLCGSIAYSEKLTVKELNKKGNLPRWAKPVKTSFNPKKLWLVTGPGRINKAAMQKSVAKMMYLIQDKKSDLYPFWMVKLAANLCALNEDNATCQVLNKIIELPDKTKLKKGLYEYKNLEDIKKDARLMLARIYARNGNGQDAMKILKDVKISNGYDKVRKAEIMVLAGEESEDILSQSHGGGHPERGFSDLFIRVKAAMLARGKGLTKLVDSIASPVISKGEKAQKWPQYQSSWAILKKLSDNNKKGDVPKFQNLKDGTYTGECRGFVDTIKVAVTVKSGKVTSIKVLKQRENRPWSALDIIPERIIDQQSLGVDAVTHATVSSCAVEAAVDDALLKAGKK